MSAGGATKIQPANESLAGFRKSREPNGLQYYFSNLLASEGVL
jgi:hypothetical protein